MAVFTANFKFFLHNGGYWLLTLRLTLLTLLTLTLTELHLLNPLILYVGLLCRWRLGRKGLGRELLWNGER